jgi:hypothetical protein
MSQSQGFYLHIEQHKHGINTDIRASRGLIFTIHMFKLFMTLNGDYFCLCMCVFEFCYIQTSNYEYYLYPRSNFNRMIESLGICVFSFSLKL